MLCTCFAFSLRFCFSLSLRFRFCLRLLLLLFLCFQAIFTSFLLVSFCLYVCIHPFVFAVAVVSVSVFVLIFLLFFFLLSQFLFSFASSSAFFVFVCAFALNRCSGPCNGQFPPRNSPFQPPIDGRYLCIFRFQTFSPPILKLEWWTWCQLLPDFILSNPGPFGFKAFEFHFNSPLVSRVLKFSEPPPSVFDSLCCPRK